MGQNPSKLLTNSSSHQGENLSRLTPSSHYEWASIFQGAPQGIAIMVGPDIDCKLTRVAVKMKTYVDWLRAVIVGEPPSFKGLPD